MIYLLYILLIVSLLLVPEMIWRSAYDFAYGVICKIKTKILKIPILQNQFSGEILINQLYQFEAGLSSGRGGDISELVEYKFYKELVTSLVEKSKRFGFSIKKIVSHIRKGVVSDYRFERKVFGDLLSGLFQFCFISMITWGFVYLVSKIMAVRPNRLISLVVALLQISGITVFLLLYKLKKRRDIAPFESWFSVIYLLQALLETGVPINVILKEISLKGENLRASKDLLVVYKRVDTALSSLKYHGTPISKEIKEIIVESWFLLDQKFAKFSKELSVLKFMTMAIFFLSSYFIYVLSIFSSILG